MITDFTYDGRDWNTAVKDALNRQTDLVYFANGQLKQALQPDSAAARNTSYTYDTDNRLLAQSHPGAPTERNAAFAYTVSNIAEGDKTTGYPKNTFTDSIGDTTVSELDRLGRLRYYRNKKGNYFEFGYDGLGRTTEIITPDNHLTVTAYTHRGTPTLITEPSGQTTTFAYDPTTGRLSSTTDAVGTINYTAYDDDGNLLTLQESTATISRTYDNLGRVTSYTDSAGNTLNYRYYPSSKLRKLIYPGGTENGTGHVEYTYWKTGRLKDVIDKLDSTSSPRTTTHHWNNDGSLQRIIRPNGTERKITYDDAARPWIIEEYSSAGQLILFYKNSYYPSDEIQSIYRLPDPQVLNAKPNIVSEMRYHADNELATFEGQTVIHDPDGNMINGPLPDGTMHTYTFDARNRLIAVDGLTYSYDAENIRTQVTDSNGTTTYITDPHSSLSQVLSRTKDGQTTRYVYGVGLQYEVDVSGNAVYYHFDHVGNTAALTNDNETVIQKYQYSPYGSILYQENDYDTPFKFSGFFGVQTDRNGLVHMRARHYNPLIRRFINQDPIGFAGGLNWYAYVNGNPISYVDPSGLAKILGSSSGQYEITTSSGTVYKNSSDSSQLSRDLQSIRDSGEKIDNITFRGHGGRDPNMITFGGGFITSSSTGIIDESGNDIGTSLQGLMNQGSEICVYGCNTARGDDNLANDISQQVPQSSVTGYRYYGIGGTNFGIHKTAGFPKTYGPQNQAPSWSGFESSIENNTIFNLSKDYESTNFK